MLADTIDGWIAQAEHQGIEKGMKKGLEKGLEQGIEKGIEKGYTRMLLKQLELKFGVLPVSAVERVQQMSTPEIMVCIERVLTATSLEEVLAINS